MTKATTKRSRQPRADSRRSVAAILEAAIDVLGERPEASLGDVAESAGVTRQTIYAHFPSRDALIAAVLDQVTADIVVALDDADLDNGPAAAALVRLLDTSWRAFERVPFVSRLRAMSADDDDRRHDPVVERLGRLIERGRAAGEFDAALPTRWLLLATIALGHAAGDALSTGQLSADQAMRALHTSVLRVVGATSTDDT